MGRRVRVRVVRLILLLPPHHDLGEVQEDVRISMQIRMGPSQMSRTTFQDQWRAKKCSIRAL